MTGTAAPVSRVIAFRRPTNAAMSRALFSSRGGDHREGKAPRRGRGTIRYVGLEGTRGLARQDGSLRPAQAIGRSDAGTTDNPHAARQIGSRQGGLAPLPCGRHQLDALAPGGGRRCTAYPPPCRLQQAPRRCVGTRASGQRLTGRNSIQGRRPCACPLEEWGGLPARSGQHNCNAQTPWANAIVPCNPARSKIRSGDGNGDQQEKAAAHGIDV